MKKKTLNFSLPARMSDFVTDENNPCFSRGKLNIFYKGTTADGRYFPDEFSERLLQTAPYAPVVGCYDREQEDFIGHAPEQQILGIIDPKVEPAFKLMDDGNVWAVVDVVLYTERPGEVGELAKKIVGHSQSLELNPETVKYKINYDEKKHFKNLEFVEGHIIGVSVLGEKQSPAFTGSAFFSNLDGQFEAKMQLLKDYCNNSSALEDEKDKKGSKMDGINNVDFMELSWQDISEKVATAISREYENDGFVVPCSTFDGHMVVQLWYYSGDSKYLDIYYSCSENGEVTLGDVYEVRPTYERVEDMQGADDDNFAAAQEPENEVKTVDESTPQQEPEAPAENNFVENADSQNEPTNQENQFETASEEPQATAKTNEVEGVTEPVASTEKPPVDDVTFTTTENEVQGQEESSSAASTEGESETFNEFENQRQRKEKINLINSYKDMLSEDTLNSFTSEIDSCDFSTLELNLLKAYKAQKSQEDADKPVIRAFYNPMMSTVDNSTDTTKSDDIGYIVSKTLNK